MKDDRPVVMVSGRYNFESTMTKEEVRRVINDWIFDTKGEVSLTNSYHLNGWTAYATTKHKHISIQVITEDGEGYDDIDEVFERLAKKIKS